MSLATLIGIIAGQDTDHLIEIRPLPAGPGREWFPATDVDRCAQHVAELAPTTDVYIGCAPRTKRAGGKDAIDRAWCLWVDADTDDAVANLLKFQPQPTLAIESGSGWNLHAYWALSHPLPPEWCERANRRLAHHIGADVKCSNIDRILRPPDSLNHKHNPPGVVRVAMHTGQRFNVAEVVGAIPDPVEPRPVIRQPRNVPVNVGPDALTEIDAETYYERLTGRPAGRGNVTCPWHDGGREAKPSMRLYGTTWACFGCDPQPNGRRQGGGVYEFASRLWGLDTRGGDFLELRSRLARELGVA